MKMEAVEIPIRFDAETSKLIQALHDMKRLGSIEQAVNEAYAALKNGDPDKAVSALEFVIATRDPEVADTASQPHQWMQSHSVREKNPFCRLCYKVESDPIHQK
jgi:hypothetical protein